MIKNSWGVTQTSFSILQQRIPEKKRKKKEKNAALSLIFCGAWLNGDNHKIENKDEKWQEKYLRTLITVIAIVCPTGTSFVPSGTNIFARKLQIISPNNKTNYIKEVHPLTGWLEWVLQAFMNSKSIRKKTNHIVRKEKQ